MASIQVTPEQMRSIATQVNAKIGEWNMSVSKIRQLAQEMDAQWDGLGNDTFNNVFNAEYPKFDKLNIMMGDYSKAVVTAAQLYDQGEQEIKNIVSR